MLGVIKSTQSRYIDTSNVMISLNIDTSNVMISLNIDTSNDINIDMWFTESNMH